MEKDGNVRNLCPRESSEQELVNEDLGEAILAAGLDRPNHLNDIAFFHNEVLLETHLEISI
jgi:hypothetical protein